ncbi:hypothetical protein ACB098_01G122900 [Castanea mollissima]|uniref:C2 domain-containing protein n=1 Tax=Castanea mollissima TaxID=60419 RepID=A0A8J4VBV9_9ROSI|nr:hypothetical protein CMV_028618 [Castanea mollissima]
MAILVVEIQDASDLMPKDDQGSASPFVEVDFDGQKQKTQTKNKDLNPQWNEKLVFNVNNPRDLHHKTIDVIVYNDRKGGHHKNFLGRVRLHGSSIPLQESEAIIQRYPLDKRGLFSHIKGDIALRVYAVHDSSAFHAPPPQDGGAEESNTVPLKEMNTNYKPEEVLEEEEEEERRVEGMKKKKKEKEVRTFHTIGAGTHEHHQAPQPSVFSGGGFGGFEKNNTGGLGGFESSKFMKEKAAAVAETRADFARAGPASMMHMQVPTMKQNPFALEETRPPLAARLRRRGDKTSSTYDLVEQMYYLYVNVVKARDLPVMDVTGSLDPYVEVKLGNYKGQTKPLEKNQYPVWNQVFAFSKERLQSSVLEVVLMDKDLVKDDFVGRVSFDLSEIPLRLPPDSPLAPQWYKLEDKKGDRHNSGEIMLAVWVGTQADEAFPDAWHSDAHNISHSNMSNTRSKVYFSPRLYYLKIDVLGAQDLIPSERGAQETRVKVLVGNQLKFTRFTHMRMNTEWNEDFMFVVSEPLEDLIIITVEDKGGPEVLGRLVVSVRDVMHRHDHHKAPEPRWHSLHKHFELEADADKKKDKFTSKILLRIYVDSGYHVLDESTHFSSDLQPSSKHLRKPSIGFLELGILSAKNLLPMKGKDGGTTDAYCVAKYGNKWIRTRTLLDTLAPRWNEQYTWDVHDPCTVITVGVFDNCHVNGSKEDTRDQRIGKVRIRLSTLETNRVYTHYYPLLVLERSGLKKHGELHLALRFTCTSWVNLVAQYGNPLLPKMHYIQPISFRHHDWLRHHAMQIVAARLARSEPPLRHEIVEYMLDVDIHLWSLRRSKANFSRIMSLLSGVTAVCKWINEICFWRNPITTCLVHVLFLILVCYPELVLPTIFLYLFVIGIWNYRFRPKQPPHMDARLSQAEFIHSDELDEEFDTFPTTRHPDLVRARYDRLRIVAGKVQSVVGDLASQGERALALLNWRDPRATAIFIIFSLIWAVFIYVTPFQVVAVLVGLYLLRHPRFRSQMPSVPVNFFKRLPGRSDMLL